MAQVTNDKGVAIHIMFNLFELKLQLQRLLKEDISLSQLARDANLHRNTIERIINNKTDRIDLETVGKLLLYFQDQGLNIQIGDLFLVEYS